MKVLYNGSLNIKTGGPAYSMYYTILGLKNLEVEVEVIMSHMPNGGKLIGEEAKIHFTSTPWENKFAFSPSYKRDLVQAGNFDIYHAQGIWQYPTYALIDVARQKRKPYIITPHGMLYPQDIVKSNAFFKKLSLRLRFLKDLNQAACVHATCIDELYHCRNLGVTAPIAIIPNPVEIPSTLYQKKDNIFRIGYMGRISRRKNIEGLLYAWHELRENSQNGELLIIGGGDEEYMSFLKSEVSRLQLTNVRFTGFISGKEKEKALTSLSVLAMPSEFENFGIVMTEALSRGIPGIATKGSPWEELNTHQCGWWIDYSQEAITEAIRKAIQTPIEELSSMGQRGRQLMIEKYSVEAIGRDFKKLYEWILGKQEKPEFVYI